MGSGKFDLEMNRKKENQQITVSRPKLRLDASSLTDQNRELRVFRLQILVIFLNESSVRTNTERTQIAIKRMGLRKLKREWSSKNLVEELQDELGENKMRSSLRFRESCPLHAIVETSLSLCALTVCTLFLFAL